MMNVKEQRKRFHLTRKSSSDAVASGEMLHSSDADADAEYPLWQVGFCLLTKYLKLK